MKNRPHADLAAALTLAGAVVVLGVAGGKIAAAHADRAPPPKTFSQNGQVYQWNVAHGVVGALRLSRETALPADTPGLKALAKGGPVRSYAPELVLSCSGQQSGAVMAQPAAGATRVTAGRSVFQATNTGRGELPRDFFKALGSAPTISVVQDGRQTTYPGPGKALAGHFQRYCASLDRRAEST